MTTGNILIVEDEGIIALDIKRILSKAGYTITGIAASAEEAIAQAAACVPDLVLMDISIEGDIDGIEVANQLYAQYQVSIIYLTAHSDEKTLRRAKASPTFGYLLKPFDRHDLATMIEIAISKHRAELAIRKALKEQQDLNALKSQFIAMVSHEFRNPLNIMLVSAELAEHYIDLAKVEQQKANVRRIQNTVRQMNALIDDVLTLSATQATQQCSPCPTDLLGFCRTLWEEAQLQSCDRHRFCFYFEDQRQNLVLTAMPSDLTLDAYFDPKLLYPALTNLLSNAIKYSPEGREIHFRCVNTLEEIQFQVQDQGIGIPASEQARLFSTFYRASNVGKIPGSGLGLSIVKQSIQLHQGTVRCDSQVNQGSTFTISIPVLLYFI